MKRRYFYVLLCLALLLNMMPAVAFADDTGSMSEGLYWLRTRVSTVDDHVVFDPTDDPLSSDPLEGSPGGSSNVKQFFYCDANGQLHSLKCSDLTFQGDFYTAQPLPSSQDDPDDQNTWSLVDINFSDYGTGSVGYQNYTITLTCTVPDYEFYSYDKDTGKPGQILDSWNWNENNKTICFQANNGRQIRSIKEDNNMSNMSPVFSPNSGSYPTDLVTITLEEPKGEDLFLIFNDDAHISITIHATGGNTGDPGLFWRAADETDWSNSTISGKCGDGNRFKFIFRDEHGNEQTVLKKDFSTTATFFEWEDEGSGINFEFKTGGSSELVYTADTTYKVPIVVEHEPGDPVTENEVAATCKAEGSYDEVVYCRECGAEISRTAKTKEKTEEHTWGEWVKNEAGTEQTRECAVCGEKEVKPISGGETIPPEDEPAEDKTKVSTPVIDPAGKTLKEDGDSVDITISCATSGAAIYYQLGDMDATLYTSGSAISLFTSGGAIYTSGGAINLGKSIVLKAWAMLDELKSDETSATFEIKSSSGGGGGGGSTTPAETEDAFPFKDVHENAYFRKAVEWAWKNGITAGTSESAFSPYASATRGQMMTYLWAAAGCPEPSGTDNPFTDVAEGAYYYNAVLWAVEKGITAGTSATTFSPEQTVTRCQAITFLYGAAGRPEGGSEPFVDVNEGDYFAAPVAWAYSKGITVGISDTVFGPAEICQRCQIVQFLYLYYVR